LFELYSAGQGSCSWTQLSDALEKSCPEDTGTYIIFDALDECDSTSTRRPLLALLERLDKTGGRLFVTSRPFSAEINSSFLQNYKLEIEAGEADLRLLLKERLERAKHMECLLRPSLKEEIISAILQNADGM
jgi:hypothetical protein